jgi:phosphopantothenoylcysteine decarboxylase/phosphopantothenate--cysteine ligase
MLEPDAIADAVCGADMSGTAAGILTGKTVLVTAGPTREPIDPVRYITNRSSGKMGYAIAAAAHALGARVILVSGPVSLPEPRGAEVVRVETAADMHAATHERIADADIFIAAAAVSDYRPARMSAQKIKKTKDTMTLELVRSPDILASVTALDDVPFTVGFAAETENVREYALGKLANKKLDMIVANRVGADRGFDRDDNTAEILWDGGTRAFDTMPKTELAAGLMDVIAARFFETRGADTQPALSIVSVKE